jgi:hypothetical protein
VPHGEVGQHVSEVQLDGEEAAMEEHERGPWPCTSK